MMILKPFQMLKFFGAITVAGLLALASPELSQAQTGPSKPRPTGAKKPAASKKPVAARGPLSKADIERLWKGTEEILLNEMRLRGLGFEPEETWLSNLGQSTHPAAATELKNAIPPAPNVDQVTAQAPDLLARIKAAAQKRDQEALAPLVHPELLAEKAKVYDLFDTANYRDHSLGRFNAVDNRRVGVQFFQLTTSQVERLHYVQFATSGGKIVVREVVTGPQVAEAFLRDEKALALSKLDLVFRAFNDGDESGLRNLCTPGLFDNLKSLAGGARLTRGKVIRVADLSPVISVPLDHKSIRVVTRVSFSSPSGRKIEFDADFERIANDLKVVRLRDVENRVIAWDPNIDNYLNRRYGLPDSPAPSDPPQGKTRLVHFKPISEIRDLVREALYAGETGSLEMYSQELEESLPTSGEGLGVRSAWHHLTGKNSEARTEALEAIAKGGTAFFAVLRHKGFNQQQFWPVVLGVSRDKIFYKPIGGDSSEPVEIDIASIEKVNIEQGNRFKKARPFLHLEFRRADGKKTDGYNFAAAGSSCAPVQGYATMGSQGVCPAIANPNAPAAKQGGVLGSLASLGGGTDAPIYVRTDWLQNLQVVQQTIEAARKQTAPKR